MNKLTVKTNHARRDFIDRTDIPTDVLQNSFDWLSEDETSGFIKYDGFYHHFSEFVTIETTTGDLGAWDAYIATSAWSGIVIKLLPCGEQYKIGSYYSC